MSGKRWAEFGSTQRYHRRSGFMNATLMADEQTKDERRAIEDSRIHRGLCAKCGRPMSVSTISEQDARLLCSCGFHWVAKRGSRCYRAASIRAECERACR